MTSQQDPKFPIKILVDKERNKVVAAEATKDFVDTLFSFLTLPLGTIIRLVDKQDLPQPAIIGSINNLYQSVQNLSNDDFFNGTCKKMFLSPRNPCEALCTNLLINVDDTQITKYFVCTSCNKLSAFVNTLCTCGRLMQTEPKNLDSVVKEKAKGGVFVKENGSLFLVLDDLKIVPSSLVTSLQQLVQLGYTDLTQLERVSFDIGLQEILKLLKNVLTSNEPLTDTFFTSSTEKNIPLNPCASTVNAVVTATDSKIEVKVVRSKSRNKVIFIEAKEDFVDFLFSFLTIPLGSIVMLLGSNSNIGCVDNLYKSVETLDSSWCTESLAVLRDPGVAPQFGCPNQPLNIHDVKTHEYRYGIGIDYGYDYGRVEGGVITMSEGRSIALPRELTTLDPRSPEGTSLVGFVKRPAFFAVEDDLNVRPMSSNSCLFFLKELGHPLDDLEVRVLSIGEAEALNLLRASLTSNSSLTDGLEDFLKLPKQDSYSLTKCTTRSRLDDLSKLAIQES